MDLLSLYDEDTAGSLPVSSGPETDLAENADAAASLTYRRDSAIGVSTLQRDIGQRYLAELKAKTGREFKNPERLTGRAHAAGRFIPSANPLHWLGLVESAPEMRERLKAQEIAEIDKVGRDYIERTGDFGFASYSDWMQRERKAAVTLAQRRADDVGARATGWGVAGQLAGSMAGELSRPETAFATIATAPISAAGSIARAFLVGGAVNMLAEAATAGNKAQLRAEVGLDYSWQEGAEDVAMAGLMGGGFGVAENLAGRGVRAVLGRWRKTKGTEDLPPELETAATVLEDEAHIARANPVPDAGLDGQERHAKALAQAMSALAEGRPVDLARAPAAHLPTRAVTPSGTSIETEYRVVDLDRLIASHGDDGTVNPAFPAAIQPRDRGRTASALQVAEIAARLDPERLGPSLSAAEGAPIVGPDGVVESGNGRTLALRRAYGLHSERADAYLQHLARLGFETDGIDRPVLVRVRRTPLDEAGRAAFARDANGSAVMAMGAAERAAADAAELDHALLASLPPGAGLDGREADTLARGFVARLPAAETNGLIDGARRLAAAGRNRLENALVARAIRGAPELTPLLLDRTPPHLAAPAAALRAAAPDLARLAAAAGEGRALGRYDPAPALAEAFGLIDKARKDKLRVEDLLAQGDLDRPLSPLAAGLVRALHADAGLTRLAAPERGAALLRRYAQLAEQVSPEPGLFGDALPPPTAEELLEAALRSDGLPPASAAAEADAATGGVVLETGARGGAEGAGGMEVGSLDGGADIPPPPADTLPDGDWRALFGADELAALDAAEQAAGALPSTARIATPERFRLREEIADALYGSGAVKKDRRAHVVIGLPAAGKSTVAESLAKEHGALIIDSDMAKERLPEFAGGIGANAVHRESGAISDKVTARALAAGDNVVVPTVGKGEGLFARIADLKQAGYHVTLHRVDLPLDKVYKRLISRYKETGRYVSPHYVASIGTAPADNFARAIRDGRVDGFATWNSDVPRDARPHRTSGGEIPRATDLDPNAGDGGRGGSAVDPGADAPTGGSESPSGGLSDPAAGTTRPTASYQDALTREGDRHLGEAEALAASLPQARLADADGLSERPVAEALADLKTADAEADEIAACALRAGASLKAEP